MREATGKRPAAPKFVDASAPSCARVNEGVCLTSAKPILQIVKGTDDPAACCAMCLNNSKCVSWNVNSQINQCFLRAVAGPSNKGEQCISGQTGRKAPPSSGPLPPSDQRPRFHFQPSLDATNDVQGPFFDPRHQLYHMGFAWHVNGTHGIGSAPNRWYHIVSKDLAHWQTVSTTPDRGMLNPDMPYDDLAVMTGSVTLVDGVPTALYSCRGSENRKKGWSSATVALATPENLSDPLLLKWTKNPDNPVLNPGFKPSGMAISNGFRDPSSAWLSRGKWRVLTACEHCNGSTSMLGLFSASQLEGPWEFTSTPLEQPQLECPDYWPVVPIEMATTTATVGLSAIKLSHAGKEIVYVGKMDEETQTMTEIVEPLVPNARAGNATLLDAATYASKSFYDPVHKQQIWTSWIHDVAGFCSVNASVCSSHTLPRSLLYDTELRAHVTPPIPQTELLRQKKMYSISEPTKLKAAGLLPLPASVETSGMQLEIVATFALPFPAGQEAGVSVRRSKDGLQSTQSFIGIGAPPDAPIEVLSAEAAGVSVATISTHVNNTNNLPPASKHGGTFMSEKSLTFALKPTDTNVTLRIFVDHSVIESYAQGGRGVITERTYPTDDAVAMAVISKLTNEADSSAQPSTISLLELEVWSMDTIWVDHL
eukprot:SAG31_NODE_1852_length_7072_cov_12.649792_1_plen_652_part_00